MGKGFNNYMTKKFFHPASKDNIKRVWMAQQKTSFDKKKQEDLMNQYQKEQEMLSNRALLGDEKAKLGLSFLYDAPPGLRKKEKEDEGEQEIKFEWQRKYNAPREAYAKNDETIRDQPFGIEVRNVRCIKCRQWGHVNTDKICPLFGRNLTAEPPQPENTTASLLEGLKEDGFQMKKSIMGKLMEGEDETRGSDDVDDPEVQFLNSLTPKQKKKLMKKLNRLQCKGSSMKAKKSKKEKKEKKKRKKSKRADSDSSDSERKAKKKKKVSTKAISESSEESSNSEDNDEDNYRASIARNRDVRPKERHPPAISQRRPSPSHHGRSRSPHARSTQEQYSREKTEQIRYRRDAENEHQTARDRKQVAKFQSPYSDSEDDLVQQRKAYKEQKSRDRQHRASSSDNDRSREKNRKGNSRRARSPSSSDSEEERYKSKTYEQDDRDVKRVRCRKQELSSSSDSETEMVDSRRKGQKQDKIQERYPERSTCRQSSFERNHDERSRNHDERSRNHDERSRDYDRERRDKYTDSRYDRDQRDEAQSEKYTQSRYDRDRRDERKNDKYSDSRYDRDQRDEAWSEKYTDSRYDRERRDESRRDGRRDGREERGDRKEKYRRN